MSPGVMYAADVVAVAILVFALFLPRHGRRDMVVAYLGVNIGVLAVAAALATSTIGADLGLGLFGVLSIIRLRSEELAQHEIAYYFAALALGLISGLSVSPTPLHLGLMALVIVALWIGDHPRLARRTTRQELLLDRAVTDPAELPAYVTALLGTEAAAVTPIKADLVNDTTLVTVRLCESRRAPAAAASGHHPAPTSSTREASGPSDAQGARDIQDTVDTPLPQRTEARETTGALR